MSIKDRRIDSLKKRYLEHVGQPVFKDNDQKPFVSFFENEILPGITAATLTSYKSAIRSFVSHEDALHKLGMLRAPSRRTLVKKTTSLRAKKLSAEDLESIAIYAKKQEAADARSRYGSPTVMWLSATLLTGLRPHEWISAELNASSNALVVENTKLTACTGTDWGERIIPLDHLESDEMAFISDFLDITDAIKKMDPSLSAKANFERFRTSCNHWLNKASRHLFKKRKLHATLMSARHQFIANLKAGGYKPVEIAYLVGHGNDLRAFESYGRTSVGSKDIFLPALPDEAQAIMDMITEKLGSKVSKRQDLRDFIEKVNKSKSIAGQGE